MSSPLTTRITHRGGQADRSRMPERWMIQPKQETICRFSPAVSLRVPEFAFADAAGTLIRKPIQLKGCWLEGLPDFVEAGHSGYHAQGVFSSLVQFELSAARAQTPLVLVKPLELVWETHAGLPVNGLQLAVGARANWQALFHGHSSNQWTFLHQGSFQCDRSSSGRLLFSLTVPRLGWWSLGFLHLCEYESRILRILPVPALAPVAHARAIWLLPNWNTYFEIPASSKGFATFQTPRIQQGTIQISAYHQGRWWWGEESVPLSSHKIPWQLLGPITD